MANSFESTINAATLGLLQNYYGPGIRSQFNDELPLWKYTENGKEKYQGLQVVRALKVRRNPGVGATSDGGVLPKIGTQTTINATISAKFNYAIWGVTGPMLKAAQSSKNAFASVTEYEMSETMADAKVNFGRQLFWSGDGTIGVISANAVGSNVITVTGRGAGEDGSKYIDVGVTMDIWDTGFLVQKAAGVTCTAISGTTTATVTLDGVVSVAATDKIVLANSANQEVQGLLTSLDGTTSSIYGVDRSQYTSYQGNLVDAGGGQLTLNLMQQALNAMRQLGGGKVGAIFCDYNTERFYNKLLVADRRYVVTGSGKVTGDGTFSSKDESYLEFAGKPVMPDQNCFQSLFLLDPTAYKKYILSEWEWASETGSQFITSPSADSFQVRLRHFSNLFAEKPRSCARLSNYISP